jgi:hypothetical protein
MRDGKRSWLWMAKVKFEGRMPVYLVTRKQKSFPDRTTAKVQSEERGGISKCAELKEGHDDEEGPWEGWRKR